MSTTDLAARLDYLVRSLGIPIDGVSIGSVTDRATWKCQYRPEATTAQRTQGDALCATADLDDPTIVNAFEDARFGAEQDRDDPLLLALLKHWPELQAESTANGKLDLTVWRRRIRGTVLTQQRGKGR